jgi:ABC-type multidrug transport system ATPase subunit
MPPILQAQALCFGHLPAPAPLLFDRLSLVLPSGVTWLGGGESSGKTTLLQLLAGQLPALTGELLIQSVSLAQDRPGYCRQVAWIDPSEHALDGQTCREIFAALPARHPNFEADALQAHIEGLSLAPHLDKMLTMLSTGTRRKVLMAAALAAQAPVTLLDQPFMALDRPSVHYLLAFLAQAAAHPGRAWVVADYQAPEGVPLAAVVELLG